MSRLLPSEELTFTRHTNSPVVSTVTTDEAISARYASGEFRIVTDQARTALPELPLVLESERYVLRPDFQRRLRWDTGKQSRLIESFLMNVPVPPIFLYEFEYSRYEVMDGLQRLTALWDFYRNKLVLTDLEFWPELEGRSYETLPLQLRQGIDRRYLSSIVLLNETAGTNQQAQALKELVFERINSGGVTLSSQESRNATSNGPFNAKLARLARTPAFCRAWGIPEPDDDELQGGEPREEVRSDRYFQSMEDVEMVLRFFAHRQRGTAGATKKLGKFLDEYWRSANEHYSDALVDELGSIFEQTIDLVVAVLGERAFFVRRERKGERGWVPRPTLLAYDAVMSAFSQHLDNAELLTARAEDVAMRLEKLYDEHALEFDGRKTDSKDLNRRDELISSMLRKVVSEQ